MNNTAPGNTSLQTFSDSTFLVAPNLVSLIVRLPVSVYIIQLIVSRRRITAEFYTLNEVILELLICVYHLLGAATFFSAHAYLDLTRMFFVGFTTTGRPSVLALICADRYLAVVKPVLFLRWKQLRYKIGVCGVIWVWTLFFCVCVIVLPQIFHFAVLTHITACCMTMLYCCSATLLVLRQPGPGEGARQKEGMNNKKLKAFRIMLMTTVSVYLVYIPTVIVLFLKTYLEDEIFIKITKVTFMCTSLSGHVQILLFFQRFGKLPFIKCP